MTIFGILFQKHFQFSVNKRNFRKRKQRSALIPLMIELQIAHDVVLLVNGNDLAFFVVVTNAQCRQTGAG